MNCQTARQALMIDPQRVPADVIAHIAECDECQRYQAQVEKLDAMTVRSIKQPARENLSQRVIAAQRLRAGRNRIVYSMAASIVAVAFALLWLLPKQASDPNWGMVMAEHMEEDPLQEEPTDPDAATRLQTAMAEVGVTTRGDMPRVVRVRVCPLGKEVSVHAVFEVNGQRVVAFLVNRPLNQAQGNQARGNEELQHKQWRGELVRVEGGTVGVFSQNAAAMQSVKAALMNGVSWHAV